MFSIDAVLYVKNIYIYTYIRKRFKLIIRKIANKGEKKDKKHSFYSITVMCIICNIQAYKYCMTFRNYYRLQK